MRNFGQAIRTFQRGLKRKWQRMSHAEFANWSSGFNSVVVALGVALGGFWSFHLHKALNAEEGAAYQLLHTGAQLRKVELDIAQARQEQGRAFGQVSLTAAPLANTGGESCFLQVNATISNAGRRPIKLWFIGDSIAPPLNIATVRVEKNGQSSFRRAAYYDVYAFNKQGTEIFELREASLQPGEQSSYPFLVKLHRDSTYLIQFSIPVDTAHRETMKPDSLWHWAARTFVAGCSVPPASGSALSRTTAGRAPDD